MNDDNAIALPKTMQFDKTAFADAHRIAIDAQDDQISLMQFWRVLQKRRWLVLICLASVTLLVAAISFLLPKRYDASARILLDLEGNDGLGLEQVVMPIGLDLNTKLETQIRIVQSDTIANSVIKQLGLQSNKSFAGTEASAPGRDFDTLDIQERARLNKAFHKALNVQLIPKTQIVEVHFRNHDPQLAAQITNAVAATYIEHNFQTKYKATQQTSDWLTKQLDDLKKHAESSQESLTAYQKKTGILGTDETHNIIIDKLEDLNKALSAAEGDRILKEAKYRIAMTENPELIANIAPESVLGALYKERAEVRSEYAQLSAKYGTAYPRVVQLQSQLNELDTSINQEVVKVGQGVRAEYRAALKSEQMLQSSFDRQKGEAYKLNEDAIQYAILRRDVESSRDLYDGLLKKLKEAGVTAGLKSSNINIVDQASIPVEPIEPNIPLNISLGLMGGLLGGIATAFIVENVDNSIRTPQDIETYCGLPSLGVIPSVALNGRNTSRVLEQHESVAVHLAGDHGTTEFRDRRGVPRTPYFSSSIVSWLTAASDHGDQCDDAGRQEFYRAEFGGGTGPDWAERLAGGLGHASSGSASLPWSSDEPGIERMSGGHRTIGRCGAEDRRDSWAACRSGRPHAALPVGNAGL